MALFRSIATVGGFTLISRLTGFARDILIARYLGAGMVSDAFFVAFKFPNLFRRLFAEGAFSAAFVPLFSATLEKEGREEARQFAERAFALLGTVVALFTAAMMIAMPWAMYGFAPGFAGVEGKHDLAVELTRLTFPYLVFMSLAALLAGVLNSLGRFAVAAATPILLNVVLIASLLGLTAFTETPGHALAWGVSLAGVVQFLWLLLAVHRAGLFPRPRLPRLTPRLKLLLTRIVPVAFGAGLYQINLLVDTILASLVSDGAVSYLYYADRVNQLPLGVIGVAIGTALLPLLARQVAAGDEQGGLDSQNRSLEFALLLTLPSMAGLIVLAEPIVSVLFQRGAFGAAESAATSAALAAFAIGLPGYVLIKVFSAGFFAREDTKSPVRVAVVALVTNIVLNLILMQVLGHVGIALATALSSTLNAGLLWWMLVRRGHFRLDARNRRRLPRMVLASLIMAGVVWGLVSALAPWQAAWVANGLLGAGLGATVLAGVIGTGMIAYGGSALLLGAVTRSDLGRFKRLRRGR